MSTGTPPLAETAVSRTPASERIASLDGLRGICILLVLWAHLDGTAGFPKVPWGRLVPSLGDFGVRVFFVISGYLITRLLIDERERTGTVSLRGFYTRRVYRIFPAFYVFIGVVAALVAAGELVLLPGDLLHALTFTTNNHPVRAWYLGHLWSLSVEEQFYLIWPALMLAAGGRRSLGVAVAVMLLGPVARTLVWRLWPGARAGVGESFPTICDAIAAGCVLAGFRRRLGEHAGYLRALRSPLAALLPFLALLVHQAWDHPRVYLPLGHSVVDVALALYVDRVVRFPHAADARLLNTAPLEYIGKLSYSLYLWQQLFLDRYATSPLCAFPLNVALAGAAAVASYYGVERTFLRLRARRG
jgi:peptidoglycan/LPS O-acetylase OafA/YrhL